MVAEGKHGNLINHYGEIPTIHSDIKSSGKEFSYPLFKKRFMEYREKKIRKMEKYTLHKWNKILKKKIDSVDDESDVEYIESSDVPDHNPQIVTADYYEYLPRYQQIGPNSGANSSHNFHTGCTACAWMCLIGYYDNVYTLDLLRGTHYLSGADNSYPSRVMVSLSEHLGTHRSENGNGGSCDPDNIKRGFSFIENVMGYSITNKKYVEDDGIPALQLVYDYLCLYRVPSVISIPGHSLIAYEVLADRNDDRGDHYLKVYQGWGGALSDDPYITYELIDDGAWTLEKINTNHQVRLDYQSLTTPVTIELGNPQNNTELVIAIRLPSENIGLLYSQDGKNFDLRYEISATGQTPPSLAVEGYRNDPYIAWKEVDGRLKLAQIYPKGNQVIELPAPLDLSILGNVGPVIQVFKSKLFYIWDNSITYTNIQNLGRSGRPWPTEYGYHDYNDSYLRGLGFIFPTQTPCFISDGYNLYFAYSMLRGYTHDPPLSYEMLIFRLKNDGDLYYVPDISGNICHPSRRKLLFAPYCRNLLFGTTHGSISELSIGTFGPLIETKYHPDIWYDRVNLGIFSSYEIGPSVFSIYQKNTDNDIYIRYHSIDSPMSRLDYSGWPDF